MEQGNAASERSLKPLEGIRVIDVSRVWVGPLCATLLADMGAEVIRVESPETDASLGLRPEFSGTDDLALACSNLVRNRLSVAVDLNRPEARSLVHRLVAVSDILIENFTPRVLSKFGLRYQELRALNPSLIMLSLSACGQTGPWRDRLTYGPTLSALYGPMSLLGYPGDPWPRADVSEADPIAGCSGLVAIMAALFHRDGTGRGQHIDLAQGETLLGLAAEAVLEYTTNGSVLGVQGNRHRTLAPHGTYRCKGPDAWISIAVETEAEWRHLCETLGNRGWGSDPRFATLAGRIEAAEELDGLLDQETRRFDAYELTALLQEGGVAAFPVLDARGQIEDPHLSYRRSRTEVELPVAPEKIPLGIPWRLSDTPGSIRKPAGRVGDDNDRVLGQLLGLDSAEVQSLVARGAVVEPRRSAGSTRET